MGMVTLSMTTSSEEVPWPRWKSGGVCIRSVVPTQTIKFPLQAPFPGTCKAYDSC